jgi:hypothetical protein
MIRIPTHGVDLWHHGLGFGERTPNRQWTHAQGEERRKEKEREEEEKEREGLSYSTQESRRSM